MEPGTVEPVVTVFRSRLRDDAETNGYEELAAAMEARARQMPGFVDFKTFVAPDGERVSLVTFDTTAHHEAWREDPAHRSAQQRGRDDFHLEYTISVCSELWHRHFDTADERGTKDES
jgi:heme-degrading monooxygenase HmoA